MVRGSTYSKTPYTADADQIVYEQRHTLAEWRAGVIPHATELLRHVNEKFHAPPPSQNEVTSLMEKLLSRQLV